MQIKDYYKTLQVDFAADQEVIAAAYKKLAQKYHPDISSMPDANIFMREINEAYKVLSDPRRRSLYDEVYQQSKSDTPHEGTNKTSLFTCPSCNSDQHTQKVSAICRISTTDYKYRQPEIRGGSGAYYTVYVEQHAQIQNHLAKRLMPPLKPYFYGYFRSTEGDPFGVATIMLLFYLIGMATLIGGLVTALSLTIIGGLKWPGLSFTVWLLASIGISIFTIRRKITKEDEIVYYTYEKIKQWEKALLKWNQLYYCSRCDCVFALGEKRTVNIDIINQYVYTEENSK